MKDLTLTELNLQSTLMKDIASTYASLGNYDQAIAIVNDITDSEFQSLAMVDIASAYAAADKDYQSLFDMISNPQAKLLTKINFYLLKAR
ncbi:MULTISPECIES: hypothetical protein [Synechocystis]|uniref:Tetratricopeptide repeat protein n=1 Tax=Synechocystis salina LEGE 00031 TaxID=1828736 RepID=A0ABR9VT88_9SYNC|nr:MULTISPECIES: hypothetical protein [Synechocystis]MBD2655458.1 hypothetical protein [Synechocystis sp. FACHB-383]MBE9242790.1 hypothetical protein [Synechocystis salina LEGE 00041]MBE9253446.1 hypothetical protein [Synechocystis salina LEGE 00031]